MSGREILEILKENDYYSSIHSGSSHLSEEQWDFVIEKFEEMRKQMRKDANG